MDRLISDLVVRRTAQAIVLAMLAGLISLASLLGILVHLQTIGHLDNLNGGLAIFGFLASPLKETFSALIAVITVTVPVVFSSVCYEIDISGAQWLAGSKLNTVGHAAFLLTVAGLLVGGATLIVFSLDKAAVLYLSGSAQGQAAIQGLINGIIAFNGIYFAQLLGLKPR